MKVLRLSDGVRGFVRLNAYAIRFAHLITTSAKERVRGDVTVLLTFLVLSLLMLGATVVATLVIVTRQRTQDVRSTAQAFYAAEVGVERAYATYYWSVSGLEDPPDLSTPPGCGDPTNQSVPDIPATYDIVVFGSDGPLSCPTHLETYSGAKALCVRTVGKAKGGTILRRIVSDQDPTTCGP